MLIMPLQKVLIILLNVLNVLVLVTENLIILKLELSLLNKVLILEIILTNMQNENAISYILIYKIN